MRINFTYKRKLYAAALAILLFFIFYSSAKPASISQAQSLGVLAMLDNLLRSFNIPITLTDHIVRKTAHFSEYALLGLLLYLNIRAWASSMKNKHGWLFFTGLLIPTLDEFLQTFVPGRAGLVSDIVLDFSGVLFGIVVAIVFCGLSSRGYFMK